MARTRPFGVLTAAVAASISGGAGLVGCLGLLFAMSEAGQGSSGEAGVPAHLVAAFERGEVVVFDAGDDERGHSARAAVLIRAPVERVWRVMIDCPRVAEFVPNLRSCRVVEQSQGRRLVEHRVKVHPWLPELTYRFEEHWDANRRIAFRRVGGDLAAMSGVWELVPAGEAATQVRYTVVLDPGFPVPAAYVRRALQADLPLLVGALRDRVEQEERER
jgi:uncharacterized membrane protein